MVNLMDKERTHLKKGTSMWAAGRMGKGVGKEHLL